MNSAPRIAKNTLALLFSGLITQLLGFLIIVYLARVLGPGDFGKMSFATATVIYFTMAVNMGLPLLGTREIARNRDKAHSYIGNIITLRLGLACICFSLLWVCLVLLELSAEIRMLIITYALGLFPAAILLDWYFQGIEKMQYMGLNRILAAGIYAGLVYTFVKDPAQLLFIPWAQLAGSLAAALALIAIYMHSGNRLKPRIDLNLLKSLLSRAYPIGLAIILGQVCYYIDALMLGFLRSYQDVGYYNAAAKIAFFTIYAGAAYFDAIFPVLSKYFRTSRSRLQILNQYSAKLAVTIGLPLAVGGSILAHPLMNFLYGARYTDGVPAFQILIWFAGLNYLNMVYSRGLWACDKQTLYLKIVSVQAAGNIVLNLLLIPPYGICGAAVATVVVEILGLTLGYFGMRNVSPVVFRGYLYKPFAAALIMGLALFFLEIVFAPALFIQIAAGAFIYFSTLYALGGIDRQEIATLKTMLRESKNP